MGQSRHIAALLLASLVGTSLAGCGGYAMFDPETAGYAPSSKQAAWWKGSGTKPASDDTGSQASATAGTDHTDTAALNSLFARASEGKISPSAGAATEPAPTKSVAVADAGRTTMPNAPTPGSVDKVPAEPRGRAYLYRGIAGLIYSRGMDKLEERIQQTGIPASVSTYLLWRNDVDGAIRDYRRDPQPIILIGHSMGGDSALAFAERLNAENIPVSLLVTYDPSRIADDVPPNVERYINIFQSSNVMGGGNVVQGARFRGHYASFNLKNHSELIHINIEKADRIQDQLITKITQLAATPAGAEGEAVPLRLEVPADAAIELWDSGLAVSAHAGDTVKSLAAAYHVPPWAIAQSNSVSSDATLTEGQRIVVPRHLVPMPVSSTLTSYAPVVR
jgi:hypothetical protein